MRKKEVQKRVLQNGKPLSLNKFKWDSKTNTFSSREGSLVLDFEGMPGCTFKTGSDCTFKTWSDCTFKTGFGCTFKYDWGELSEPPIFFSGSMYTIGFLKPGWIKSNCIEEPMEWWETNIVQCAEENNYTKQQQDEYKFYIHCIVKWMKRCKVDKEIKQKNNL